MPIDNKYPERISPAPKDAPMREPSSPMEHCAEKMLETLYAHDFVEGAQAEALGLTVQLWLKRQGEEIDSLRAEQSKVENAMDTLRNKLNSN